LSSQAVWNGFFIYWKAARKLAMSMARQFVAAMNRNVRGRFLEDLNLAGWRTAAAKLAPIMGGH
jgi:hypothetical protein